MAVSDQDVRTAEQSLSAAQSALQAAQAKVAALAADPTKYAETESAKVEVSAARDAVTSARAEYTYVRTQYNREHPTKPAQTPGQQATDAGNAKEEADKDKNERETGIRESSAARANRERAAAPKPPRQDSPAQQTTAATGVRNANTGAQRAAETGRHNQQTEQLNIINAQKDALYKAGMLYNTTRGQVSAEARAGVTAGIQGIQEVRGAATTMFEAEQKRSQRAADLKKARASFVGDTLNTAMPKVVELMLKTEKGSPVAGNFLKAFLVMAKQAYHDAGLEDDEPPIDITSPAYQTLARINGYELPDRIPMMPTAAQISFDAAAASAVGGHPVDGWQGPIGIEATRIPPMPPGTNGEGRNTLADAAQTPEGRAIETEIKAQVQPLLDKQKAGQPLTPEEQRTLQAAQEQYKARVKALADKKAAARPGASAPSAGASEADALKQEVRSALISGDPNQRLRIMSGASAALENKAAGKPLTEEQTAILANLDPEDVALIQQHMTPEIRAILAKPKEQLTQQDYTAVQTAVVGASTGIKNRPVGTGPAAGQAPAPTGAQADRQLDPQVVAAQQQEHEARQREREAIKSGNPELDAMMTQVETEEQQAGQQARESGSQVNFGLGSVRQKAEERLKAGEKPGAEYYDGPGKLIKPPTPLAGPPDDPNGSHGAQLGSWFTPGRAAQQEETPSIPEMPKLFELGSQRLADDDPYESGHTRFGEAPAYTDVEMPTELAPRFRNGPDFLEDSDDEEERRRRRGPMPSLFDASFNWR